ncbi:uncharacterized protein LOC100163649 [Acyrthosiphon pisum]|uniref:ACYPI004719 protein n=1 Tax=Acyrthosiphon pisum TaxID=7029 RepID=C4WW11_ACYPI|nr:uncharacterized protein LOC100163649 [Acyrthosiphon pisum]BAH72081.1 ACYPI004719 [Acyrthosiphon pisum]|eukprot:NP_001162137.1 uncharacterized protein LOC100163649 [Acyrthosiphon pisum]
MEMLSNGYRCIKKCTKALKQSLFDWILHKFNNLLTRTMSDIPTASTSTASTSSASTSQTMPYTFDNQCPLRDLDYTTTDESEMSSDESEMIDDESSYSNDNMCKLDPIIDDNMDDTSWSSTASSNTSYGDKSSSENSETESILKELIRESWTLDKSTNNQENTDSFISPILILVQQPCETEGQMNEIGIDLINVEEHAKRLKELEKEIDFIESTEWMYRPIDSFIR